MRIDGIQLEQGSEIVNCTIDSGDSFPANPNLGEIFYLVNHLSLPSGLYEYNQNNTWAKVSGTGATGGGSDQTFFENDKIITSNYTITTGRNAGSFGPIEIDDGINVEIPNGSTWSIV